MQFNDDPLFAHGTDKFQATAKPYIASTITYTIKCPFLQPEELLIDFLR